jgi:hypothetical protein
MYDGRDRPVKLDFGQDLATIFALLLLFWGCQTGNFPSAGARRVGNDLFCSINQEIYWRIALLAYDEPIKSLHGSVKMTGTQKPVRAITFAAPKKSCFFGAWIVSLDTRQGQPVSAKPVDRSFLTSLIGVSR